MVTGIVLAAGFGRRFGSNKLLAEYRGNILFTYPIQAAILSQLDAVIVVTQYPEIEQYCAEHRICTVTNPLAKQGQSSSVVLGVESCESTSDYLFLLADQPGITPKIIDTLLAARIAYPGKIIQPIVAEQPSAPVLFPNSLHKDLLLLRGDTGGREVLQAHPELVYRVHMDCAAEFSDIDLPEDLQ